MEKIQYPVIIRMCKFYDDIELFFPYDYENGKNIYIECWCKQESHSECVLEYFENDTKSFKGSKKKGKEIIKDYLSYYPEDNTLEYFITDEIVIDRNNKYN